jgi:hypothetical protein
LVLLGHLDADWAATARDGVTFDDEGIRISLRDVRRAGRLLAATTRYEADGKTWTQSWENEILDDDDLDAALDQVGLHRALPDQRDTARGSVRDLSSYRLHTA